MNMKLKKICATVLTVFMLLMLIPVGISAASLQGLDFTLEESDPAYPGSSGAGWMWDIDTKILTLDGLSLVKDSDQDGALMLPDGSTVMLAPGSQNEISGDNGMGIVCYGDLIITGSGSLSIDSDDNGIRVVGDLAITDLTELEITSDAMGMRVGPGQNTVLESEGNLTISNCGDINIVSRDDGMRVTGNLYLDSIDIFSIDTNESVSYVWATGMRVGPGDGCNVTGTGDAHIANVGHLVVTTNDYGGSGLRISGDLLLENVDLVDITSYHTGIRAGPGNPEMTSSAGNVDMIDCGEINIISLYHTGIRSTGNVTVDSVDLLKIEADHMGMRVGSSYSERTGDYEGWSTGDAEGYVHLIDSNVEIAATRAGIRSNGAIWAYQSSLLVAAHGEDSYLEFGLYATQGDIIIERSIVDVSAFSFALVTGNACGSYYDWPIGGDIVIIQSHVIAQVDAEEGMAAIFAGDNLEPEDEGHAQIIIIKSYISVPDAAYIVDVDIPDNGNDIRIGCQSITGDAEVEVITSWEQALNYVEIEPYFYISYDPNGADGDLEVDGPYTGEDTAIILENPYTREGYLFTGWNTAADGSGTMYLPGQEIPLQDDLTLYAQFEPIMFTVTYDANGGTGELADENSPYMTGSTVTVLENAFTKADYVFISWNTAADGSGTAYDPGDTFVITGDVVLYAQYDAAIPQTGNTSAAVLPGLLFIALAGLLSFVILKKQHQV